MRCLTRSKMTSPNRMADPPLLRSVKQDRRRRHEVWRDAARDGGRQNQVMCHPQQRQDHDRRAEARRSSRSRGTSSTSTCGRCPERQRAGARSNSQTRSQVGETWFHCETPAHVTAESTEGLGDSRRPRRQARALRQRNPLCHCGSQVRSIQPRSYWRCRSHSRSDRGGSWYHRTARRAIKGNSGQQRLTISDTGSGRGGICCGREVQEKIFAAASS